MGKCVFEALTGKDRTFAGQKRWESRLSKLGSQGETDSLAFQGTCVLGAPGTGPSHVNFPPETSSGMAHCLEEHDRNTEDLCSCKP